jgi:hypothetical protein
MICINRFWLDAARDNAAERRLFESMVSPVCVCGSDKQGNMCGNTMIAVKIDSKDECRRIEQKLHAFIGGKKQ